MSSEINPGRTSPIKHPLVQAFGMLLKRARKREDGMKSEAMAKALGMSHSLYRLIESGSAVLQPDRAFNLIKAVPKTHIEFSRLSSLLVAFQIIGESRRDSGEIELMKRDSEDVLEVDPGLRALKQKLVPVWPLLQKVSEGRLNLSYGDILEDKKVTAALMRFLAQAVDSTSGQPTMAAEAWARDLIYNTRPLYLDLVSNVVNGLRGFAPQIDAGHLARWEKNHRGRFLTLYAVLNQSLKILLDTYDEFDWSFIADVNFQGLHVISLIQGRGQRRERELFAKLANKIKGEGWFHRRSNEQVSDDALLHLHFVNNKKGAIQRDRFARLLEADGDDYKNAWVYELLPLDETQSLNRSYHVVFLDDRSPAAKGPSDSYDGVHCSWSDTESWVITLQEFLRGKEGSTNVE